MSAPWRTSLLILSCCSKGDDHECKAEDEAKDAARNIDHDQCDIGKQVGDRVAIAAWILSYIAQSPPVVVSKHPVAAENDPDEEKKGEQSFGAVPGCVDVVSLFFSPVVVVVVVVVLEEAFDDVDGCLEHTDTAKHNQPYWDDGLSSTLIDVHTPCMVCIWIQGRMNHTEIPVATKVL